MSARLLAGLLALAALAPAPGVAGDFGTATPGVLWAGPASMLADALPFADDGVRLEAGITRWFALPGLVTREAALGVGWRGARVVAGLSQTGDPELGWNAVGFAVGGASHAAGAALRAVARRDRTPPPEPGPLGPGVGFELGGGAWVRAGAGVTLHASAPQVWLRGTAPPLLRGFEVGGVARVEDATLWLAQRSPPRGEVAPPDHEAGVALEIGPCRVWAVAHDRPLRAGIGVRMQARSLAVAASVDSHPVLGETTRLAVALGRGAPP